MNKEDGRLLGWQDGGLPALEELIPLTQTLITPDLASAFRITQEPVATPVEFELSSQSTLPFAALHPQGKFSSCLEDHPLLSVNEDRELNDDPTDFRTGRKAGSSGSFEDCEIIGKEEFQEAGAPNEVIELPSTTSRPGNSSGLVDSLPGPNTVPYGSFEKRVDNGYVVGVVGTDSSDGGGSVGRKPKKQIGIEFEDADSGEGMENSGDEPTARTLKRPRLVWTPQLHKRFVDAVAHLGIKNAVPKTIMQLMNVEGLTRENVASHLQKYRLYLKRNMQGLSSEGPSASDQLFASTPVPPGLAASAHFLSNHRDDMIPLMLPLPMSGLAHAQVVGPLGAAAPPYASFNHHLYNSLARSSTERLTSGGHQELHLDSQGRPGSPPRQILTLFPH